MTDLLDEPNLLDDASVDALFEQQETETVKEEPKQEKEQEERSFTETELTEFEIEQQKKGWNPKGPSSAEEWAKDKPLYDEISKRGRYVKKLERTIEELKDFMSKQEKLQYEKAIKDLTSQKEAAISIGDNNKVSELDQLIQKTPPPLSKEAIDEVEDFRERNQDWLESKSYIGMEMTAFAREQDRKIGALGLPVKQHMALLEEHVKEKFPEYFNKKSTTKNYSAVESSDYGSSSVQRPKKTWTIRDLSPDQKKAANDFDRAGIMKVDDYIKSLVELGELKNGR